MSEQPEELDFEERRKRLEQLFAADPHLSPTMRARQLTEEQPPSSNGHAGMAGAAPAVPVPAPPRPLVPEETAPPVAAWVEAAPAKADGMISLSEARDRLKENGAGDDDSLKELRESVLTSWRRDIYSDR